MEASSSSHTLHHSTVMHCHCRFQLVKEIKLTMAFNAWVASLDVQQVTSHILPWTKILLNILADDVNAGPRLVEKNVLAQLDQQDS